MTVRQVGRQAVFSWGQQLVAIQQDVENGQTVAHDIECLIVQGADRLDALQGGLIGRAVGGEDPRVEAKMIGHLL